jgi:tripartite-type tricarboxylate transporter receptor subunit TctC
MQIRLNQWMSFLASALLGSVISNSVLAQVPDYPAKPIKVVVTFPPGGSSDAIIRILSTRLNEIRPAADH